MFWRSGFPYITSFFLGEVGSPPFSSEGSSALAQHARRSLRNNTALGKGLTPKKETRGDQKGLKNTSLGNPR